MAEDMLRNRVVYEIPSMTQMSECVDRIYKEVDGLDLRMAVYVPSQLPAGEKAPGIIFIHGGPFPADIPLRPTNWGQYISLGQLAAAFGMVGVTFHHRYHKLAMIDEAGQDVEDALTYVRENASDFALDPDKLCFWAISGGGLFLSQPIRTMPAYLKCIVAYYARMDMRPLEEAQKVLSEETLQNFSAVAAMDAVDTCPVPLLIARAGLDKLDLNQGVDHFINVALSRNAPIDIHNHPQGRHAFDILDNDHRSKDIIEKTLAFVRSNLHGEAAHHPEPSA